MDVERREQKLDQAVQGPRDALEARSDEKAGGIEVAGGLGQFAGKVWRVGVMGESCNRDYVKALAEGLDQLLAG